MGSKRKAPNREARKADAGRPLEIGGGMAKSPRAPIRVDSNVILLLSIFVVALALRLLPIAFCLSNEGIMFSEFDPYYHMRRIVYAVDHFPLLNSFDSYVNYPYGYGISWPPLFDLIAASLSLIVGLGSPGRGTIEAVSAAVPVLLGLLSIGLLYYIVKDAIGREAALVAAFFMAVLPASIFRTAFAYTDHHALEVCVSLAMYLCFMRAAASARKEKLSFKSLKKRPLVYAALAGIGMAGMVFSWDGAPIFIGVIVAYSFIQYAYDAFRGEDTEHLTVTGFIASLIAVTIVTPFIMACPAGRGFVVSALYLSWFHILYLAAIAMFFIAMWGLFRLCSNVKAPWFTAPLAALIGIAVLVASARFALPQMFNALEAGIQFLMGSGNVLVTIVEVEPLFSNNGQFSFDVPWAYFSTGGLLAILGFAAFLFTRNWKSLKEAEVFLLVWTVMVLLLGLLQKRFVYVLAVNVALFAGFAMYEALKLAGFYEHLPESRGKKASRQRGASITPPMVAVAIVSAILLIPILMSAISIAGSMEPYARNWNEACRWVDENTPKTSYAYSADNGTHPEYGIMCWWDYGNYILYEAERPAVANNFQTGVEDAAHFFIAQDEASANAIMEKRNAKYVMVDYRMGSPWAGVSNGIFENMPYLAGEDSNSYHMSYLMPVPYGSERKLDGSAKYYGSMYSRLFNGDGLGGRDGLGYPTNGLEHYRLIYMTQGKDPVKVFEYVKGATINGKAAPGSKLELWLNVTAPDGDHAYYSTTTAGIDGAYSFTVPYPTSSTVGIVKTGDAYTIKSGSSSIQVQVSASAVDNGETVVAGGMQ
ncbi:oligosaccharyl transferase, archaeosortase A system-associated [Methanocella conradii]|uniref:oligosaccharyl transferase, archaeosortase A system-associated n=1 Tax=Methanocella conradii TaxID=1175444 RepID=UPI0024B349C0|nr:oligosaccharyl transferase, archaeosortase A system-associated [Methanocella conradii]MDI6898177.1 oligosaccharyl transferase, archaeosortase A system-associated [Methanocella conradii]